MTRESQIIGQEAEQRVIELAEQLGSEVKVSPDLDYGMKVDVVIDGRRYQVSATGKSRRTKQRLRDRGIITVIAGEQVPTEDLLNQLTDY